MSIVPTSEMNGTTPSQEFEDTFNEHARLVYRTAYAVTGSHEDAEDVLQTIFVRLARREFSPELRKHLKAYLYRAAVNVSLNVIRSRRREAQLQDVAHIEPPSFTSSGVDDELCERLHEAIGKLKPEAAQMLVLRYTHNLSDAEIAKMLGVSRGTVAVKLFRLRARLKKLIASMGDL